MKATLQGLLVLATLATGLFFSTEEGGDKMVKMLDLDIEKTSYKVLHTLNKNL